MSQRASRRTAKPHARWRYAARHLAPRWDPLVRSDAESRAFVSTSHVAAPDSGQGHRATDRRRQRHTYFVGRRPHEVAELYTVTEYDVRRLDREWLGPPSLDWRGHDMGVLQLSRVLLARVTGLAPSRGLAEQFALSILAQLPDDGFVLSSEEVWRWLQGAPRGQRTRRLLPTRPRQAHGCTPAKARTRPPD
jgi:hypothetical protein